jgi:hypothetical protein
MVPLIGTTIYLVVGHFFAYGEVLSNSVRQNLELSSGLLAAVQAPAAVLAPGLIGMDGIAREVPGWLLIVATLGGVSLAGFAAFRGTLRPLIVTAMALVAGGYLVTYAARAHPGDLFIFEIQRYHLFPQVGFALLFAAACRPAVRRFDVSRRRSLVAGIAFAALLLLIHEAGMRRVSERDFRFPELPAFLEAGERLEQICEKKRISLLQAIQAIEPTQPPWHPRKATIHPVFCLFGPGVAEPGIADSLVRSTLIESLSMEDREAIFGGLNAGRFRKEPDRGNANGLVESRFVTGWRMSRTGPNTFRAQGRGSWLEFELGPDFGAARALWLPDLKARNDVRICWAGEDEVWSSFRSVYWTPGGNPSVEPDCFSLEDLPHWRPGFARKIRLVFREWGEISAGAPRFLR